VVARSPVPIVIDHFGLPGGDLPESGNGQKFVELLRLPHVWLKLSAPYRMGGDPLTTVPPANWLRALVQAAPERCVWGSDWPHTPPHSEYKGVHVRTPYRKIEYARLLGDFVAAISDDALAQRILVENPNRLYGF
jgi:predicted TIM-barrel fold metal-dependent hydrolase